MIIILITISIVVLLIYLQLYKNTDEMFSEYQSAQISPNAMNLLNATEIRKNIRLNKYNRIDERTVKKPTLLIGETKCYRSMCPNWIDETSICWSCK